MSLLLECLDREGLVGKSDFVAKRGCLVEIAGTPLRYEWGANILVQKLDNVYYLFLFIYYDYDDAHDENSQRGQHSNQHVPQSAQARKRQYGGRKYETYITVKKGGSKPDSDTPMDYNFEFNSVVYTQLGEHSAILAGEVDCCLREDTSHYVQLKTESGEYKDKYLKWWLQSFLIGVGLAFVFNQSFFIFCKLNFLV